MTLSFFAARANARAVLLFTLLPLTACGGGGDDPILPYESTTTSYGVASGTPLAFSGAWVAFLADEASSGGQDLNADGEVIDQVAVVANVNARTETNLGVAATALAWADEVLFLVVEEAFDGRDWGGAVNTSDLVLLYWDASLAEPVFVDTLDRGSDPPLLVSGYTLFYASTTPGAGSLETSLFAIDPADPGTRHAVLSQDAVGALAPRLVAVDEGLVLVTLDETTEGRDLNGDADTSDDAVLALLDGTGEATGGSYSKTLRSTELALAESDSPLRASWLGENDWLVGFLVDETAQGGTNLNLFDGNTLPAAWKVTGCADDADSLDQVLHVIEFAAWDANPTLDPPRNTGIAGAERVLIVGDVVATISPESDDADCSLNGDVDSDDRVLRWFRTEGDVPVINPTLLLALDENLPGAAQAVAELDGVLVIQVDELADSRDRDGASGTDRLLVGWIDPRATSPTWRFNHGTSTESYATATWMSELPGRGRLGIAYAESSNSADLNEDGDELDSMATFATLTGSTPRLIFPGFPLAAVPDQPGISMTYGMGYFRGSEAADGQDLNGNGTETDILLLRTDLATGQTFLMGALNTLPRDAVETALAGALGAAFVFDETIIGKDISGDQDASDLVIRHFAFQ